MRAYAVDKPLGWTSHDVVARARRRLGTRRVGHGGTLDPLATGVLVVLADEATKLSPYLTGSDKAYLAWVAFGVGSPTLDAEGPVDARADAGGLTAERVGAALPPFLVLREQVPPAFAAVKRGGVKGYEAARRGEPLDLPPRPAGYRDLQLLAFGALRDLPRGWRATPAGWVPGAPDAPLPEALDPSAPAAVVALTVRSGTYVRAFARDLGAALGVPAHLAGLRRTRAGAVDLRAVTDLASLDGAAPLDPVALLALPTVPLDAAAAARVRDGRRVAAEGPGGAADEAERAADVPARVALVDPAGALVAIAEARAGVWRTLRVWRPGA